MDPMGHRFPQEIWRHGEAFFSHLGDTFLDLKDEKKRFQNARLKTNHIIWVKDECLTLCLLIFVARKDSRLLKYGLFKMVDSDMPSDCKSNIIRNKIWYGTPQRGHAKICLGRLVSLTAFFEAQRPYGHEIQGWKHPKAGFWKRSENMAHLVGAWTTQLKNMLVKMGIFQ